MSLRVGGSQGDVIRSPAQCSQPWVAERETDAFGAFIKPVLVREAAGRQGALWCVLSSLLEEEQAGASGRPGTGGNLRSLFSFPVTFDMYFFF